jgi:hypothetical protein
LISVRKVSEKEVLKAIEEHSVNSSVSVLARVLVASFGPGFSLYRDPSIREEIAGKIQAYENIRYMASMMRRV